MDSNATPLSAVALGACLIAVSAIPITAHANGHGHANQNKSVTVYFTRHAEKKTTTTSLGSANNLYQTPDEEPIIASVASGETKGRNRDDVCGESKCAEELSDKGLHRANLLASWFLQRRVVRTLDAVYSSHKHRTWQTVLPTATLADLDVIQLPADGTELNPEQTTPSECVTIEAILNTPPGDTILIAGHSGTLYDIMGDGNDDCDGLGLLTDADPGSHRFPRDADGKVRDYGDIWKIVIRNGKARFIYRVNLEAADLRVIDRAR